MVDTSTILTRAKIMPSASGFGNGVGATRGYTVPVNMSEGGLLLQFPLCSKIKMYSPTVAWQTSPQPGTPDGYIQTIDGLGTPALVGSGLRYIGNKMFGTILFQDSPAPKYIDLTDGLEIDIDPSYDIIVSVNDGIAGAGYWDNCGAVYLNFSVVAP